MMVVKKLLLIFVVVNFGRILYANSVSIANCDSSLNWVSSPAVITSILPETQIRIEGTGSVRLNAGEALGRGRWAEITYTPQVTNWFIGQVVSFWMYMDRSASRLNVLELRVYDTVGNWSRWTFRHKLPAETWHYYTFWLDSPTESSVVSPDLNRIGRVQLRYQQDTHTSPEFNVYIDDMRLYHGFTHVQFSSLSVTSTEIEAREEVAAQSFIRQEISPWVDISRHITPADRARGFVEIGVSFHGAGGLNWILYGDDDAGGDRDLRAFCDGVLYELIDTRFKAPAGAADVVFPLGRSREGVRSDSRVVLDFEVPRIVNNFYNIFLGIGNVQPALADHGFRIGDTWVRERPNWMGTHYMGEAYIIAPLPGLYADFVITDVAEKAKWEYDGVNERFDYVDGIYSVARGAEVEFDATISQIYRTTGSITVYQWDFGDGNTASGDRVRHTFNTTGERIVSLTVTGSDLRTFPEYPYARRTQVVNIIDPPLEARLHQNGPNPFELSIPNPVTRIRYELSQSAPITMRLYSMTGRLIRTLIDNQNMATGIWEAEWDGRDEDGNFVDTGVYIYTLDAGAETLHRTMLVIR